MKQIIILLFTVGMLFSAAETKLNFGVFELEIAENKIFIPTRDKIKSYKRLQEKHVFYIDFHNSEYRKYIYKQVVQHPVVKEIRLGYHDDFYRFAFSLEPNYNVELMKRRGGVEILFKPEYVVIESIKFLPAE